MPNYVLLLAAAEQSVLLSALNMSAWLQETALTNP